MLVAEDNEADIEILTLAFDRAQVSAKLRFVNNGAEVIEYLKGEGRFANRAEYPMPRLLLLDLKMPLKADSKFSNGCARNPDYADYQ